MATITTRAGKGSPLTNTEVDDNFSNLNSAKYESGSSPVFGNVNVESTTGTAERYIQVGSSGIDTSAYAYIDFVGDTTYTDFGLRLVRGNSGANTHSSLQHRGTGNFYFNLQDGSNSVIFNEGSYDTDFRVESNDNTHMLFVEAGTNRVGINNNDPSSVLHISGTYGDTGFIRMSGGAQEHYWYLEDAVNSVFNIGTGSLGAAFDFRLNNASKFKINVATVETGNPLYVKKAGNNTSGGNIRLGITGNNQTKWTALTATQWAYDAEPEGVSLITSSSHDVNSNNVNIGGGLDEQNAATYVGIKTAADPTTRNGTTRLGIYNNGNIVANDGGHDSDFRIESDSNANMLYVEGETNRVAIGHNDPRGVLDIYKTYSNSEQPKGLILRDNTTTSNVNLPSIYWSHAGDRIRAAIKANNDGPYGRKSISFWTTGASDWASSEGDLRQRVIIKDHGDLELTNTVDAPTNSQSNPPRLRFRGEGWNTSVGSESFNWSIHSQGAYSSSRGQVYPELRFNVTTTDKDTVLDDFVAFRLEAQGNSAAPNYAGKFAHGLIVNENSHSDGDFRVESDSSTHALFVNADDGRIDVGAARAGSVGTHATVVSDTVQLGTALGDTNRIFGLRALTNNSDYLTFRTRRITEGNSGWNHAVWDITREVDNTADIFQYQTFGMTETTFNVASANLDFRIKSMNKPAAFLVNANTDTVSTDGTFIHNSNTGASKFYVTRSGATNQSVGIYVDDNTAVFDSKQDEVSGANFLFRSTNATASNVNLLQLDYSAGAVFNEQGKSYQNFRIETDGDTHKFYTDAYNNEIKIGLGNDADQGVQFMGSGSERFNINYNGSQFVALRAQSAPGGADTNVLGVQTYSANQFTNRLSFSRNGTITEVAGSPNTTNYGARQTRRYYYGSSAFSNPTVVLMTLAASGSYPQAVLKVTVMSHGLSANAAAVSTGYVTMTHQGGSWMKSEQGFTYAFYTYSNNPPQWDITSNDSAATASIAVECRRQTNYDKYSIEVEVLYGAGMSFSWSNP